MATLSSALISLRPAASWQLHDPNDFSTLEWLDKDTTPPTLEQVQIEITRLQAEYDSKEYQRQRARAYPSFADQFDLLYHGGLDAWKAAIDAVKQEYPKP
jgi:hypothetical protein